MRNEIPLLTIAIPTYNRAHLLDRLLTVLEPQLRGESSVELLISDNASSDGTQSLVENYRNRGLTVRYIRNEQNAGADRNILQCFERASGKFVWIFSDDDLIAPGAIARVLRALRLEDYDLVCIRCYSFMDEYVKHKEFVSVPDLEFTDARSFARHVHVFFTFISGIIVNKQRVSSTAHPPLASLFDTNLVQLGPYYTALNHHRRSLLIRDPLIAATGNSSVGYAMYRVFGPNLVKITNDWISDKSVCRAIIDETICRFFPAWILSTRQSERPLLEDPHKVLQACYGRNPLYWLFNYPIYALPMPLAKLWLLAVKAINRLKAFQFRKMAIHE